MTQCRYCNDNATHTIEIALRYSKKRREPDFSLDVCLKHAKVIKKMDPVKFIECRLYDTGQFNLYVEHMNSVNKNEMLGESHVISKKKQSKLI